MGDVTTMYLSRAEVAHLFQVSPATVARWSRQGKLPYTLTLGGRRRYPREKILALLQEIEGDHAADLARHADEPSGEQEGRTGAAPDRDLGGVSSGAVTSESAPSWAGPEARERAEAG